MPSFGGGGTSENCWRWEGIVVGGQVSRRCGSPLDVVTRTLACDGGVVECDDDEDEDVGVRL